MLHKLSFCHLQSTVQKAMCTSGSFEILSELSRYAPDMVSGILGVEDEMQSIGLTQLSTVYVLFNSGNIDHMQRKHHRAIQNRQLRCISMIIHEEQYCSLVLRFIRQAYIKYRTQVMGCDCREAKKDFFAQMRKMSYLCGNKL